MYNIPDSMDCEKFSKRVLELADAHNLVYPCKITVNSNTGLLVFPNFYSCVVFKPYMLLNFNDEGIVIDFGENNREIQEKAEWVCPKVKNI